MLSVSLNQFCFPTCRVKIHTDIFHRKLTFHSLRFNRKRYLDQIFSSFYVTSQLLRFVKYEVFEFRISEKKCFSTNRPLKVSQIDVKLTRSKTVLTHRTFSILFCQWFYYFAYSFKCKYLHPFCWEFKLFWVHKSIWAEALPKTLAWLYLIYKQLQIICYFFFR